MHITALGNVRHLEVISDEELEIIQFITAKAEPFKHSLPQGLPYLAVAVPQPLADVVKQNRQQEEGLVTHVSPDIEKVLLLIAERFLPLCSLLDLRHDRRRHDRVHVNGKAVIYVLLYPEKEVGKFRDVPPQEPAFVHLHENPPQLFPPPENIEKLLRYVPVPPECVINHVEHLFYPPLCLAGKRGLRFLRYAEHPHDEFGGLNEGFRAVHVQFPLVCGKMSIRQPFPERNEEPFFLPVRQKFFHLFDDLLGKLAAERGENVVEPHESLCAEKYAVLPVSPEVGKALLEFEVNNVCLSPGDKMHVVPDSQQVVEDVIEVFLRPLGYHPLGDHFPERVCFELYLERPQNGVKVPQPSFPLFDVGLEKVNDAPVLFMTVPQGTDPLLDKSVPVGIEKKSIEVILCSFKKGIFAADKTVIHECCPYGGIFRGIGEGFLDASHGMPYRYAGIPQGIEHLLRHRLDKRVQFVMVEEKKVDVRLRAEVPSPISSHRQYGHWKIEPGVLRIIVLFRIFIEETDEGVKKFCIEPHQFKPSRSRSMSGQEILTEFVEPLL